MATGTLVDVVMPQMGVSVSEGTISRWIKSAGEQVSADEALVEISTDKVDTEVPSPVSGTVGEILVGEGETVAVGTRIATIATDGGGGAEGPGTSQPADETPAAVDMTPAERADAEPAPVAQPVRFGAPSAPEAAAEPQPATAAAAAPSTNGDEGRTFMSPVVARMIAEHSLDIGRIPGTGRGGRVTKKDVERYLAEGGAPAPADAGPAPAAAGDPASAVPLPAAPPKALTAQPQPAVAAAPIAAGGLLPGEESSPLSTIRKAIARNMRHSIETAAHVTSVTEVDMTRVVGLRAKLKPHYTKAYGVNLSYLPFIARAVIEAIPHWPWVNGEIRGDQVITRNYVNLGVAVAINDAKGLVVPVIKHAEELNLLGLSRAVVDLADRARANALGPDDWSGGTFTITNPGVFGAILGTPIIPQPQSAIIDVEAIVKRPVVVTDEFGNDSIAVRSIMYLPISYDHRLIDGAYAAQFMGRVKRSLETWGEAEFGA